MGWGFYRDFEYVPVAVKKDLALKHAAAVAKREGREQSPVTLAGRKIATTFWGLAWCDNLVQYSDFSNRLPRGATYVRNGSVVDLVIKPGCIEAIVAGSDAYSVKITISELPAETWRTIKQDCTTSIDSLLDLLAGKFSDGVMQRLTRRKGGLFPAPKEIWMQCSCPDGSYCCKHLAAVMYGVGSRLDKQPELLFTLRKVDPQELVSQAVSAGNLESELAGESSTLGDQDLGALFGIELDLTAPTSKSPTRAKPKTKRAASADTNRTTATSSVTKSVTRKRAAKIQIVDSPTVAVKVIAVEAVHPLPKPKPAKAKKSTAQTVTTGKVAAKVAVKKRTSRKPTAEGEAEPAPLTRKSRRPR